MRLLLKLLLHHSTSILDPTHTAHAHFFFFLNNPAPPELYPLSLHAPLPILPAIPLIRVGSFSFTRTVCDNVRFERMGMPLTLVPESARISNSSCRVTSPSG